MARTTVYIDHTTHLEVIGDYTNDPRRDALDEAAWQNEYTTHAGFANMRAAHPAAVAGKTSKGVGRWKPGWGDEYKFPQEKLVVSSDAAADFDTVPAVDADGAAIHTLTIKKINEYEEDVTTGSEAIRILTTAAIPMSTSSPSLVNGTVQITVGPTTSVCDLEITAADPANTIVRSRALKIRFK